MSDFLKSKINLALSIQVAIVKDDTFPDEEGYLVYRSKMDQLYYEIADSYRFVQDVDSFYYCDTWEEAEIAFNCLLSGMDRDILDSYMLYSETHCTAELIEKVDLAIEAIANLNFEQPTHPQKCETNEADSYTKTKCNIGFGSWG